MLSLSVNRIFYMCDKVLARNLRSRSRNPEDLNFNPGINRRLKAFQQEGLDVEGDAEEFIEQSESNFLNVGKSYNKHVNEQLIDKVYLRQMIVKEKYFKENMPNLLTWSEKEQIRHLASSDPDEWTPEKIAESFPVTVPVVKKLLKYPWKPATEQRIARHDHSAMRNWKELKEGSLNIPEELCQHFLKFSNRTIPPLNKKSSKIDITQDDEKMGEFESIIAKCAAKENDKVYNNNNEHIESGDNSSNTNVNHQKTLVVRKRVTLDELTEKIKKRLEGGKSINMPDQIMLDSVKDKPKEASSPSLNKEVELFNEQNNELNQIKKTDENVMTLINYPERIRIPKKAYKKGATYKVNDCFYDHDGRFLYRVIGMNK